MAYLHSISGFKNEFLRTCTLPCYTWKKGHSILRAVGSCSIWKALQKIPPKTQHLLFSTPVLSAISLSQKVGVDSTMPCFLHYLELLAENVLQNTHSTATSLIVAVLKLNAKIGRDHVTAATYPKPGAVTHGLNAVDAWHKDLNASMKSRISGR